MRIGYCEDEAAFYPQMEQRIRRWADRRGTPVEVLFYGSGERQAGRLYFFQQGVCR